MQSSILDGFIIHAQVPLGIFSSQSSCLSRWRTYYTRASFSSQLQSSKPDAFIFHKQVFFEIILVRTERIYFSRKVFLAIAVVITWRISFFRASFSWKFQSSIPKAVIIHELVFLETLPLPFYYMTHSSCTSKFFSAGAVVKNWRFSNSRGRLFGNCTCQKGKSSKSNLASKTFVQHSHWHCHFETRWETWPLTCDYSAKENYWWTNL